MQLSSFSFVVCPRSWNDRFNQGRESESLQDVKGVDPPPEVRGKVMHESRRLIDIAVHTLHNPFVRPSVQYWRILILRIDRRPRYLRTTIR